MSVSILHQSDSQWSEGSISFKLHTGSITRILIYVYVKFHFIEYEIYLLGTGKSPTDHSMTETKVIPDCWQVTNRAGGASDGIEHFC